MAPTLFHIVLIKYQESLAPEKRTEIVNAFLALKDTCLLPDGSTYIISIEGGRNNSPEGLGKGYDHAFIVTFKGAEDRDYYIKEDTVHHEFTKRLHDADVTVFDFESGAF
ncbi:stress responsive a b barrel domain-containing protein [Trametopsis cervina]|nr:stress responsive a b barrel domain-containing protein [Trametopsis cervina]